MPLPTAEEIIKRVLDTLEPLLRDNYGYELVDIEWRREPRGWILRLYIDHIEGKGKIALGELTHLSRHLSDYLDVEDVIPYTYTLEVSSPGINRPLRTPEHFKKVIGKLIRVKLERPINGRKQFTATLLDADDTAIYVEAGAKKTTEIKMKDIKKANLIFEWGNKNAG